MKIIFAAVLTLLVLACQPAAQDNAPGAQNKLVVRDVLTLADVQAAFTAAKLPMRAWTIYNEETDPNHLLGRPKGYLEKADWLDSRTQDKEKACTIEIFADAAAAEKRKAYVEAVAETLLPLAQYQYLHKNVLVRVPYDLPPKQAAEYEAALNSL